jgi:hypothetical protein
MPVPEWLKRFTTRVGPRAPSSRSNRDEVLRRYPNHLELIDSGEIPNEYLTGPDLSYYVESAEFYYNLIVESAKHFKGKQREVIRAELEMSAIASERSVNATWGLSARGPESIPFALALFRSKDSDHRAAATSVFTGWRDAARLPSMLQYVHAALRDEKDRSLIDPLIATLGELRSRESIPVLARYVCDTSEPIDIRNAAAIALGRVVHKRFDKSGADAVLAASEWLVAHPGPLE